jgi:DHA2 family multidrug resistance protein
MVHEIDRQAQMLAFNDIFWFIAMVTLAIIPLIFLMKKTEKVSLVPPIPLKTDAEAAR